MTRVMVVEDSASIRLLLVRRLEMAGHEVIEAADGAEALAIYESRGERDRAEIVLLDAMMPNLDGAATLARIRERDPRTPVLVISAVLDLERAEEWRSADGHLGKPIDFDDLLERIERLTSGRPRP